MSGLKNRKLHMPVVSGPKAALKTCLVVLFSLGGGTLLGWTAPTALNFLFVTFNRMLSKNTLVEPGWQEHYKPAAFVSAIPFALLGLICGAYLGIRILRLGEYLGHRWEKMEIGDKVNFFVGIFAGLIASVPVLQLYQALDLPGQYRFLLIVGVTVGLGSLSVYLMQSMSDYFPWSSKGAKHRRSGIKLLDTNIIIDGRIYDVAKTGFLSGAVYVPGFVLEELQYIADSHDALRRQRGRRGLEVLRHMQAEFELEVGVYDKFAADLGDGVDARLVRLGKAIGADIVTNDFNLRRVAELQDVHVMSINDLAIALRPNVLPQETFDLLIIREGSQVGQGVGYLEDGTMVVVENGKAHVNETVEVVVTQVIQTERGKMIFAEVDAEEEGYEPRPRRRTSSPRQSL